MVQSTKNGPSYKKSVCYFCPILTEPQYGRHTYNKNPQYKSLRKSFPWKQSTVRKSMVTVTQLFLSYY
jgi:hypothetical protein